MQNHLECKLMAARAIIRPFGQSGVFYVCIGDSFIPRQTVGAQTVEVPVSVFSQTEATITIEGPAGDLEAKVADGSPDGALTDQSRVCVVCHPHPEHGGTMSNKVVTTLVRSYRELGVATVRFNFRGVGKSQGRFDRAVGEVDDLLAVVAWLRTQKPDSSLLLAGFSFGSAVAAAASHRSDWRPGHLTLVAPPVERYRFDDQGRFPCPVCVIQGGADEVVVPEGVFDWFGRLQSPAELLRYPEAGHFFHGGLTQLKQDLQAQVPTQLDSAEARR